MNVKECHAVVSLPLHSHTGLLGCVACRELVRSGEGIKLLSCGQEGGYRQYLHDSVPIESVLLHNGGPFPFQAKSGSCLFIFQPESNQVKTFPVAAEWQRRQE